MSEEQTDRSLREMEEAQKNAIPPTERNASNLSRPAILTIAALFVTCPSCSHDITLNTPDGVSNDWSAAAIFEFDGETQREFLPKCQECGQHVTISVPKALPVNP